MGFDYSSELARFTKKADALRNKDHISVELVSLLQAVGEIQLKARRDAQVTLPDESELTPADQVWQGKPLLSPALFPHDRQQARELFASFAELLTQKGTPFAEAGKSVTASLESGELKADEAFDALLQADEKYFAAWSEKFPETPKIVDFLAQASLTPSLAAAAEQLAAKLPEDKPKASGICPICGRPPFISTLRGKEGKRYCTCSFCHHEYPVTRISCAFCGETDHTKLRFFTVKEEPGYRVDVCATCKSYIKTVDFREMDRQELAALDDLDSLVLDFVAIDKGYRRATSSAWGF